MMDNGSKLRLRRLSLGKTLLNVAEEVGVSEGTVSRWESGNIVNVRGDRILRYAEALRVPPEYITGEMEELPEALPTESEDDDIRIVARKMDKMSKKDRKKLLQIIETMFEEDDDDE